MNKWPCTESHPFAYNQRAAGPKSQPQRGFSVHPVFRCLTSGIESGLVQVSRTPGTTRGWLGAAVSGVGEAPRHEIAVNGLALWGFEASGDHGGVRLSRPGRSFCVCRRVLWGVYTLSMVVARGLGRRHRLVKACFEASGAMAGR